VAKVLIIEDDDVIARGMARHLETAGFDTVGVANGETGLARLRYERPDVCVLDLMLPGVDGWRVIEQARDEGIGTPIVVVSARGTEHDRVHALEIGADDYLVKPFSMKELAARVRVAARRGVGEATERRGDEIVIEELRLDPKNVQAYVDGESAELTPTEFRLVYTLAREAGRVLTRDELLQRVDSELRDVDRIAAVLVLDADAPPRRGPDPRDELLHGEGLHEVVVGPDLEGVHAVVLRAPRADDHDRSADSFGARRLDHPPAVHARQHQVEDAHIRLLVAQAREAGLALVHPKRIESRSVEMARHPARDDVVVLDDENLRHVYLDDARWRGVGVVNKW